MIKEMDFVTEKNLRSKMVENELGIATMQMVKEILLLEGTEFATTEMVATYFDVEGGVKTVESLVNYNRDELELNGYKVYSKENLLTLNFNVKTKRGGFDILDRENNIIASGSNKGIALFSKRAILNVGMLLRDSPVAIELRSRLLDIVHDADKGIGTTQTIVEEIDEVTKLSMELGVAMVKGDLAKCMELNAQINELKNKRIEELEGTIGSIVTHATTIDEFRRQSNVLIKSIAYAKGINVQQMWSEFYNYLENKSGYKLKTRCENAKIRANEERISKGKKPYSSSTLNSKFSTISMVKDNEYDGVLEILKGIAVKYDINIVEKLSI